MMNKILILIIVFGIFFIYPIQAQITAKQMGMLDFKIDQNLIADEMNGTIDVTAKLQDAVDNARQANQSLFIPSGTYKVSSTINCILTITNWILKTPVNIIGSSVHHPVIKLADSTAVFNGPNPKAVFHYQSSDPATYGTDAVMQGGVRAVDFDLGAGNTNAVALYWGCAQYCFIEDININARDGFAGLTGIGGANQLLANISVIGGQHGLYLPDSNLGALWGMPNSPQNTITGCTFTNQTDIPVVLYGWGGITFVGVSIVTNSGLAILMNCGTYAPVMEFPFSMIDSKIEFTSPNNSNTAIQNLLHGTVSLNGVYIKGAGTLCDNNGDENLTPILLDGWTYVKRYNYVDKNPRAGEPTNIFYAGTHYDAVSGTLSNTAIVDKSDATPPTDLTSKHIWATTPSFEDADAFLVPAGSSATIIQNAINNHQKVCLAKGTYPLNTPIILKANSIFFGCPGFGICGSILTYGFTPTAQTWLIGTENNASATTYLMDISTDSGNLDFVGSLHWMAGRNAIIRTVHFDLSWNSNEMDLIRMYFSDNGGGRVFNYQDEKALSATTGNSLNHRKIKASGTSQPLTFYGLDLERGGSYTIQSSFPCFEMDNSSNIRIFGAKTETYQPYAKINNCSNILLTNIIDSGHLNPNNTFENYIEITGTKCDKIEVANAFWLNPPSSSYLIIKDPWNTNEPSRTVHLGLYHRNLTSFSIADSIVQPVIQPPLSKVNWTIFPNPTNSECYLKSNSDIDSTMQGLIFNSSGVSVKTFTINSSETSMLDLSNLASGIYYIVLQAPKEHKECFKVVKI